MKKRQRMLVLALMLGIMVPACSQEVDTLNLTEVDTTLQTRKRGLVPWVINFLKNSNKKSDKPFDFSFIPGPFYDATTSISIGLVASGIYSFDRQDSTLRKSNISMTGTASVTGALSIGPEGHNYLRGDRYRWNYRSKLSFKPLDFWGLGYDNERFEENKTQYDELSFRFESDFLFRIARETYIGPNVDIYYMNARKWHNIDVLEGQKTKNLSCGLGLNFSYDSRDFALNASRGHYLAIRQMFYPKVTNQDNYFNSTDITYSTYHRLWKKCVGAIEYHSRFSYGGDVSWYMMPLVGYDGKRMRGYYEGRYRDRNIIEVQAELRQELIYRFGITAWGGFANIFPHFEDMRLRKTLPNYGMGIRWEFQPRINVRLDCGMGRDGLGVVFNINEAF